MRREVVVGAFALCVACGVAQPADAADYVIKTFDVPGADPGSTQLSGVNDLGQVVGSDVYSSTGLHNFVDTNGKFTNIVVLGSDPSNTTIADINNKGELTGSYDIGYSNSSGFVGSNGAFNTVRLPFAIEVAPSAINNAGQIAGSFGDAPPSQARGFLYKNGQFSVITVPGALMTDVTGLNDAGQITGIYSTGYSGDTSRSFLDTNGVFTNIDVPGAMFTFATGINNGGQITGYYEALSGTTVMYRGFVDTHGAFSTFGIAGAQVFASGINDAGEVVGSYDILSENPSGDPKNSLFTHGFIATPLPTAAPEPASLALFGVGVVALLIECRRGTDAHGGTASYPPAQ